MQTPWWIAVSAPPSLERLAFPYIFGAKQILPQLSSSLCWVSPLFGDMMSQIVNLILEGIHTFWVLASGCAPRRNQTQHASVAHAPLLSLRRLTLKCRRDIAWPEWHCSHSKNPRFPTVKAVYCFDALSIAICQKPTFRSKQENYPTPTGLSMASCIWGSR